MAKISTRPAETAPKEEDQLNRVMVQPTTVERHVTPTEVVHISDSELIAADDVLFLGQYEWDKDMTDAAVRGICGLRELISKVRSRP